MSSRSSVSMQQKYNRVVVLVDMDCFYCQVEEKLDPQLKGQPLAVVQYNAWRGGGIIAVNYAARAKGVTRHMRGDEAKEHCPEIQLVKVPNIREKADLGKYREAGKDVANVLQRFTPLLERASVDEAYMDITEEVNKRLGNMTAGSFMLQPQGLVNTYALGYTGIGDYVNVITKRFNDPNAEDLDLESGAFEQAHDTADIAAVRQSDIRLLIGAAIAGEVRAAVKSDTGYDCSAGIAHNKILAKLACGMNKPNKQTILPLAQIPTLFQTLPLGKIRGLGGKFGEEICASLQIKFLGEMLAFTEQDLQRKFEEKNGTWLYNICRGIDLESVTPRFYSKSIGCCKKFPGRNKITGLNTLRHWLGELANEVCDRIEKDIIENNRRAKQMVISFVQEFDGEEVSSSRSAPLNSYDQETLIKSSLEVIQSHTKQFYKTGSILVLNNPIKFLGISVGKFETILSGQSKLQEMFANQAAKKKIEADNKLTQEVSANNDIISKEAQSVEVPVAKKPTFMQNFLRRGSEANTSSKTMAKTSSTMTHDDCEDMQSGSGIVTSNRTDTGAVQIPESTENIAIEITQAPEKRSFFLNALKKQKANDIERELTTNGGSAANDIDLNKNKDGKNGGISKSFFAKILKNSRDEENNVSIVESESAMQSLTEENFEAEELQSNDIVINHTAKTIATNATASNLVSSTKNKRKYTTLQDNETQPRESQSVEIAATSQRNSAKSYEGSYAEFAIPELSTEFLQMIKCEICKANVPSDARSLQLHQDHHVAMQLSQQLRDEYRTEVKAQTTANKPATMATPPTKKSKKSPVQAAKSAGGKAGKSGTSITKFLKPAAVGLTISTNISAQVGESEPVTEVISLFDDTVDAVHCDECNTLVASGELQAHKDFHIAKALQRQLNMLEVRTVSVAKKANAPCNSTLNATQSSAKNIKPITTFFSQSNC